jgi:hypothetical protein
MAKFDESEGKVLSRDEMKKTKGGAGGDNVPGSFEVADDKDKWTNIG